MNIAAIHKVFVDALGLSDDEIVIAFDVTHPDCIVGVVLQDVSPVDIGKIVLRLHKEGLRIYINVVEKEYAPQVQGLDAKTAWEKAFDFSVATARS